MIERMDLFLPPRSQYQVLHAFTYSLAEALVRSGVQVRVLEAQRENPQSFVDTILQDRPECTLSFNGLLPDEEGRFFCDMIEIPHVACLVDGPQHFMPLIASKNNIITCIDRFFCDFFQGVNFKNALFMPHAVDERLFIEPDLGSRSIDVLMLASYLDYESILEGWRRLPILGEVWEEAANIILFDRQTPPAQAIAQAMDLHVRNLNQIDPKQIDFLTVLDQLEDYVKGRQRVELVRAIKDAKVEVYGSGKEKWAQAVADMKNVTVHDPVSYTDAIKLMRQSKIVLNSMPSSKYGAHERIFSGIASGAALITNDNIYMHENFKPNQEILLFQQEQWAFVNEMVNEFVSDEKKRIELVSRGQEIVRNGHTWDHRAAALVSELGPILSRMRV